jgi:hypothetical protein
VPAGAAGVGAARVRALSQVLESHKALTKETLHLEMWTVELIVVILQVLQEWEPPEYERCLGVLESNEGLI